MLAMLDGICQLRLTFRILSMYDISSDVIFDFVLFLYSRYLLIYFENIEKVNSIKTRNHQLSSIISACSTKFGNRLRKCFTIILHTVRKLHALHNPFIRFFQSLVSCQWIRWDVWTFFPYGLLRNNGRIESL